MLPNQASIPFPRFRRGAAGCAPSRQDVYVCKGPALWVALLLLALALIPTFAAAQGLDPAALLKPATDTWPTYNGDYSGARYSTLDQINAGNVNSLTLAWAFRTHGSVLKSTPLEVNGILYFSAPDNVWAVDARYGRQIWHYQRTSEGDHIGHRGVRHVQKLAVFHHTRRAPRLPRRQGRHGALGRRACRRQTRLLLDHGSAGHSRSRHRRRFRRRHRRARLSRVHRSGNWQESVDAGTPIPTRTSLAPKPGPKIATPFFTAAA